MSQRRLRPSQGGKFVPPVVPEILTEFRGWSTVNGCTTSDDIGLGFEEVEVAGYVNRFVSYSAAAKLCTEPLYDEPRDDQQAVPFPQLAVGEWFIAICNGSRYQKVNATDAVYEGHRHLDCPQRNIPSDIMCRRCEAPR